MNADDIKGSTSVFARVPINDHVDMTIHGDVVPEQQFRVRLMDSGDWFALIECNRLVARMHPIDELATDLFAYRGNDVCGIVTLEYTVRELVDALTGYGIPVEEDYY